MSKKTNIGDWARLSDSLWTKPKVLRIAEILGGQRMLALADQMSGQMLMRHATCSALSRVFVTVNRHARPAQDGTQDAVLSDVCTSSYLDIVADMPGIQRAMQEVGWAVWDEQKMEVRFPNYLEYNNLAKGTGKRGRPGNPDSPEAKRKRKAREQSVVDNGRTNDGQIPDDAADKEADKPTDRDADADEIKTTQSPSSFSDEVTQSEAAAALEAMKQRVSGLRDVWKKSPWWTPVEETALLGAMRGLGLLTEADWLLLKWFFAFSDRRPEDCNGAVTGRRDAFLDNLTGYKTRADSIWRQQGKPDIGLPKVPKPTSAPPRVMAITPEEAQENARAFRERLADLSKPDRDDD